MFQVTLLNSVPGQHCYFVDFMSVLCVSNYLRELAFIDVKMRFPKLQAMSYVSDQVIFLSLLENFQLLVIIIFTSFFVNQL